MVLLLVTCPLDICKTTPHADFYTFYMPIILKIFCIPPSPNTYHRVVKFSEYGRCICTLHICVSNLWQMHFCAPYMFQFYDRCICALLYVSILWQLYLCAPYMYQFYGRCICVLHICINFMTDGFVYTIYVSILWQVHLYTSYISI